MIEEETAQSRTVVVHADTPTARLFFTQYRLWMAGYSLQDPLYRDCAFEIKLNPAQLPKVNGLWKRLALKRRQSEERELMRIQLLRFTVGAIGAALLALAQPGMANEGPEPQIERHIGAWRPWFTRFTQVNLVANKPKFKPQILEPNLQNALGVAIRPAGFGGHFWVAANTTKQSLEYVGDVDGVPLFQDDLKVVDTIGTPTGVVFNAGPQFVFTQPHPAGRGS